MRRRLAFLALAAPWAAFGCGASARPSAPPSPAPASPPVAAGALRAPEAFASIADSAERSRALFVEATRVMLHPRCVNCHPQGDTPGQGDEGRAHDPPVARGRDDRGVAGLACSSCHQDENAELARVPGAPKWHLAPRSMAWAGRTPRAICEQLKDPARNGGKSLRDVVDHAARDPLVAWGWAPGAGRTPAPGSQERFGAIVAAWVDTGAECPLEEVSR